MPERIKSDRKAANPSVPFSAQSLHLPEMWFDSSSDDNCTNNSCDGNTNTLNDGTADQEWSSIVNSSGNTSSISLIDYHLDWIGVVRKKDGRVQDPIDLNNFLATCLGILCFFGLPLNFHIFMKIVYNKSLRQRPRYTFQLAITLSCFATLLQAVVEVDYFRRPSDDSCHFFVAIIGLSYGALLFNLLLALINCYVAINHPLYHTRKVTVRRIVFWLLGLNFVLALSMKWVFVGRVEPLVCAIQINHTQTFQLTVLVLFVLCIAFAIVNFVKTWKLLPRASRAILVPRLPPPRQQQDAEAIEIQYLDGGAGEAVQEHDNGLSIHVSSATLCRMELETIKSYLIGILPLLLLCLPMLMHALSFNICLWFRSEDECSDQYLWLAPYLRVLACVHALVNPILLLLFNNDFELPKRLFIRILEILLEK